MEWTEEQVTKLIEQYRKFENLWNPIDSNYFKRNEKVDAWSSIGIETNRSADDCRKKMVSLLSSYRREKSRTKMSMGTGKGAAEIYRSRWFAYDLLKFLEDRNTPREGLDTESMPNELTDGNSGTEEDISIVGDNFQVMPGTLAGEMEGTPFASPRPPKRRREKSDKNTELLTSAVNILKTTAGRLQAETADADGEISSICAFLSTKMMSYPRNTRQRIQHEMYGILMKVDHGHFELQSSSPLGLQQFSYESHPSPNPSTSSNTHHSDDFHHYPFL